MQVVALSSRGRRDGHPLLRATGSVVPIVRVAALVAAAAGVGVGGVGSALHERGDRAGRPRRRWRPSPRPPVPGPVPGGAECGGEESPGSDRLHPPPEEGAHLGGDPGDEASGQSERGVEGPAPAPGPWGEGHADERRWGRGGGDWKGGDGGSFAGGRPCCSCWVYVRAHLSFVSLVLTAPAAESEGQEC